MTDTFFFTNWESLIRTGLLATLTFVILVALLRFTGKRTLSKWNAFDFIITIALGSAFASAILTKDISLADGTLALALLMAFQWIITKLSVLVPPFQKLVKAKPAVLYSRAGYHRAAMTSERVTETEILAAIRAKGFGDLRRIEAVVLETDGSFSVIPEDAAGDLSALQDLDGGSKAMGGTA